MRSGFIPIEEISQDEPAAERAAQPVTPPAPSGQAQAVRQGFTPLAEVPAPAPAPKRQGFVSLAEVQAQASPPPKLSPEQARTEALRMAKDEFLNSPPVAVAETAANLLSQGVAMPVSGLMGLATEAGRALGLTKREGADVVREVGEALTYQPRGAAGQKAVDVITWPLQKLAEGGEWVGKRVLDATGSPAAATAVDVAINMLPAAVVPAWKSGKRALGREAQPQAIKPAELAEPAANAGPEAVPATATPPVPTMPAAVRQGFTPLAEVKGVMNGAVSRQAGEPVPQRVPGLGEPETMVQQPVASELPPLRGPGDQGLPAVGGELRAVPGGRGAEAAAASVAVPDRLEPGLRAGERALDGEGTPVGQAPVLPGADGRWLAPDDARGGAAAGAAQGDAAGALSTPRTARYALMEADDLKAAQARPDEAQASRPDGQMPVDASERAYAIAAELDPARLVDALDDAQGAPIVAADGAVQAGNARALAIQKAYSYDWLDPMGNHQSQHYRAMAGKAQSYRQHLGEQAARLGLNPETVAAMKKPVLVRLADEPSPMEKLAQGPTKEASAAWSPGANYVGFIDDGKLPNAGEGARAWSGDRAKPIRREEILGPFAQALGTTVYEGPRNKIMQRKGVMGYFKPRTEEVRIRKPADLETAAHELAHLIEQRFPEVTNSWGTGKPGWQARRAELKGLSYRADKIDEGFAEFVRHWMTQPEVAATRAPEFSRWFDDFVARNPHREAIEQARGGMQSWFGQDAIDRARSKIGQPLRDAPYSRWDAFRQAALDDLHGVYKMERELSVGRIAPAGAYESARLTRASASIADGAIRYGAPVRKPDGSYTYQGRGLQDILKPVSESLEDSLLYFVGRSARELQAQGREHLFTPTEIDAMIKLRTPEREQAFKDYQKWNGAILDFAEAHGVINPEARAMWQRSAYLPFHRVGQPDGFKGKPGDWSGVKALKGGTENLRDVLGNMTANAAMLIDKSIKNEARAKIAALAEDPGRGGGRFMVKIDPESRPTKVSTEAAVEAILKGMGLDAKSPEAQAVRDMLAGAPNVLEVLQGNMPPAGGNVVAVLKEGKPVWYEVGDPLLLRALESIDRQHLPTFMRWLTLPKRITQAAITLTPDFMAANLARDTIMAGVMTRSGFKPFVDSIKGMRLRLTEDPLYKDFIANGGGLSSMYLDEGRLRADLGRFYSRQGIDVATVLNSPAKLLGFLEKTLDAVESSSRLGEYKRAIEAGEHPRHAAYRGREVSVDFAQRGDSMAINAYADTVVFLRAAMTSWDRLYRGVAHDPNRFQIMGRAGMLGAASVALYMANKDEPRYQALPDWDRDGHWHFFIGGEHFRYPKIFDVGALASTAERTVEALLKDDPQGLGKDVARIFATAFGVNLIPQAVAPLVEQAANKNFFTGALIEPPGMEDVQPFLRAKPTTSETLRAAGMATAELPEALQINPVRAEALVRGYLATWGMYGLALADEAFFPDSKPELRTDQLPVVRRFYSQEPAMRTRFEDEFYKALGEAGRLRGTLRELDRQGNKDLADEKERAPMAGEALPLQRAAKAVSDLNADMRQVRRDDTLSPADKRLQLDALMARRNDLLQRIVQEHEQSIKPKEKTQ